MGLKKKNQTKVQLQVYIPEDLAIQLNKIVAREETTKSSMVEDCLERGLKKYVGGKRKGAASSRRATA